MHMKRIFSGVFFVSLFLTGFFASLTNAREPHGSNFPGGAYPETRCEKPVEPPKSICKNVFDRDIHLSEIDEYNSKIPAYHLCIKDYYSNCHNDMERIQKAIDDITKIAIKSYSGKNDITGGSNLIDGKYPEMSCKIPEKPKEPTSPLPLGWRVYDRKVKQYELDFESYKQCVDNYIFNAKEDLESIRAITPDWVVLLEPLTHKCR